MWVMGYSRRAPCRDGGGNGAGTPGNGVEAEGGFIAFCALGDTTAPAMAQSLQFFSKLCA